MILEVEGVVKGFSPGFIPRRREVLRGVTFSVEEGEIFGFLGPNGAGKTTTIKLLVGLLFPDKGSVRVRGKDVRDPESRRALGFLPENPYFYDYLTGREFLDFYARLYGLDPATRKRRIDELLERLTIGDAADRALRVYSKGMLQRIGFAQTLLAEPSLFILDEPMSGLDPIGRRDFRDLILEQRQRGATVFFSSHILQDAEMICDRVAILVDGKVKRIEALDTLLGDVAGEYEIGFRGGEEMKLPAGCEVVARSHEQTLVRVPSLDAAESLRKELDRNGARLLTMVAARATLEDIFLSEINAGGGEST